MADHPRIACLLVPLFPLAARLRSEPELKGEALAILAGQGETARVVAATRRARQAGIRPGLTLSQARARLPKLIARPRDPVCEQAAQEALLDVAASFSPRVQNNGEGLAYLDLSGLERHFPTEEDLARDLVLALERQANLPPWVGVASSRLAARMAALQGASPTVVPAGGEANFLAPLPLPKLTSESATLQVLESWGIRSVGDFAGLPEDEVASRLGATGSALQAMAKGQDPRPLVPHQPPATFEEGLELEWPLVALEPFLFVARAALERLAARLAAQGLACARLELDLQLEPDGQQLRSISLPAPSRDVKTLLELLRLDLDGTPPGAPLMAFRLRAHTDRPRHAQLSLFGPAALSPERLAATLARLFALLGKDRVGAPQEMDGHRPERFTLVPFAPPPPPGSRRQPAAGRQLLAVRTLRPAIELEVLTNSSDPGDGHAEEVAEPVTPYGGPRPLSIRSVVDEDTARRPHIDGKVRVASGPWSLEEGWWSPQPVGRDYWDVELAGGSIYRIYRDRHSGAWFADGIYD